MTELERLPIHPVPDKARFAARNPVLVVDGLVDRPHALSADEFAHLPRESWDGDFACEEGWVVPDLHWQGVRLADVLAEASPQTTAQYVRVGSGDYVVPFTMEDASKAVLCDTLDGQPLTLEQGAPWRLLVPGEQCFTSVKWVDHIEIAAAPGENTGEQIARARLASQP
ncbi:MAG: molybdopterin-dependent oxidoreductase [Dehalococcoidia bacterium]|nr:molybdopterin-dependent oxidoreductase [Dehalococcoidia bacterium]